MGGECREMGVGTWSCSRWLKAPEGVIPSIFVHLLTLIMILPRVSRKWGFSMNEILVLVLVFLAIWGGHYMPWSVFGILVDDAKKLHRPLAYGFGCMCIFAGFVVWVVVMGEVMVNRWLAVRFLALDIVMAGAGAMVPRGIKWICEVQALKGDVADYEQTIDD